MPIATSSNDRIHFYKRKSLINSKTAMVTTPTKLKITYRYLSGYQADYNASVGDIHAEVLLWGMKAPQTGDANCPDPVQLCPASTPVAGGDAYVGTALEPCVGDKEQSKIIEVDVDLDVLDIIAEVRGFEKLLVVRNISIIGTPNELTINEYSVE